MFSFFQEVVVRASEVGAAVRALDVTRGLTQRHPCDLSFSAQAQTVCHACEDLSEVKTALGERRQECCSSLFLYKDSKNLEI